MGRQRLQIQLLSNRFGVVGPSPETSAFPYIGTRTSDCEVAGFACASIQTQVNRSFIPTWKTFRALTPASKCVAASSASANLQGSR
jgi:hypothetical protein